MTDERYKQYPQIVPGCGGDYQPGSAAYENEQTSLKNLEMLKKRSQMSDVDFLKEYADQQRKIALGGISMIQSNLESDQFLRDYIKTFGSEEG